MGRRLAGRSVNPPPPSTLPLGKPSRAHDPIVGGAAPECRGGRVRGGRSTMGGSVGGWRGRLRTGSARTRRPHAVRSLPLLRSGKGGALGCGAGAGGAAWFVTIDGPAL